MKSKLSPRPVSPEPAKGKEPLIAIVGNPNAGKTTLFNGLTGSRQKVGNYPGVTVEKVTGSLKLHHRTVECLDIPGIYSLAAVSEDERVAVEVIEGKSAGVSRPDLLVCVVDATNLERNLYLYSQVADMGMPTVVALTMVDRLESKGKSVDLVRLSNLLGCEVIPIVGHKEKGIDALRTAIEQALENPTVPELDLFLPNAVETKVASLRERLARMGADYSKLRVRRELIQPTEDFTQFFKDFPEVEDTFSEARHQLESEAKPTGEVASRYEWAGMVEKATIKDTGEARNRRTMTDRVDFVLTHRVFGLIFFIAMMGLVFMSIYTFAAPLMDGIDKGFKWLQTEIRPRLDSVPILQSLVVDGIIGGVGAMLVFLPQILILFFFIAILEGTGYLARAAFLMDRLLGWCGLNGRAFIPLLSSFACAIPGIMAARVMPDARSRLATILVSPLMSCSARLPVYMLLIGAFIEPKFGPIWAGITLYAMHLLGLVVAIPIAWILNRKVIKGKRLPFLLELPPYQWPKWRDVWIAMYFRGKIFVKTAGTIIVFMSFLIWALCTFPGLSAAEKSQISATYQRENPRAKESDASKAVAEEKLAHSYLGRFGKTIEPVFLPAGFDWRITTSILAAFPARETVVPSLGIIFSIGEDVDPKEPPPDLRRAMQAAKWPDRHPLFTAWTAVGMMVFFALCAQCMATLATVKRETNSWKWPVFMFTYMTGLAYIAAVGIHQLSLFFGAK